MVKKIQIEDLHGNILFEYEKKNNTINDTLEEGVMQGISFNCADLRGADLSGANLRGADLSGANLCGANLSGAKLCCANLREADLWCANIRKANLRKADISYSYLRGANLSEADLREANLREANLRWAILHYADLYKTDISGTDIRYAELCGAKNVPNIPMACPLEGAFIGWKKVYNYLIKLEIPEDAKRSSATTNKCRCDKAKVLSITDLDGSNPINELVNDNYIPYVTYKVGEMVYPDSFDEDRWNECSHGIHFFVEKVEAINY